MDGCDKLSVVAAPDCFWARLTVVAPRALVEPETVTAWSGTAGLSQNIFSLAPSRNWSIVTSAKAYLDNKSSKSCQNKKQIFRKSTTKNRLTGQRIIW